MRWFLVALLALAAGIYFYFTEVGKPVGESALIVAVSQPEAGLDAGPASPGDPTPSALLPVPAPGGESVASSERSADQATIGLEATTPADSNERIAALRRLADLNMAQLYAVLWQVLEVEEPGEAELRAFILATLEKLGDHAPGEVLAALVQTAPTPELRLSALQLLAEASQELTVDPFNQALGDQDPAIRRSAQTFYKELGADALLDAVSDAVLDSDQTVRLTAFSTLEEMYEYAPIWKVADSVVDDADPLIRMRALELLAHGDRQVAIDRLEVALGDPDPKVNELARALLTELEQGPS